MPIFLEHFWEMMLITLSGYITAIIIFLGVELSPNFRKRVFGRLIEAMEKEEK